MKIGNLKDLRMIGSRDMIMPVTQLEQKILADPELQAGFAWGKPRPGHPEGKVRKHVEEVLYNIDTYAHLNEDYEKLRIIAIIHDSFKNEVDMKKPRSGENHHAMIARRFAEKFLDNEAILDIIELHDEAYNSWQVGNRGGNWRKAEKRAIKLIHRLGKNVDLYLTFYYCDNKTGNKSWEPYDWFKELVDGFKA